MPKGGISIEYSKMVGDLASDLRRRRGLSQEAAAELAGVSQTGISKVELGKGRILPARLFKFCTHWQLPSPA